MKYFEKKIEERGEQVVLFDLLHPADGRGERALPTRGRGDGWVGGLLPSRRSQVIFELLNQARQWRWLGVKGRSFLDVAEQTLP